MAAAAAWDGGVLGSIKVTLSLTLFIKPFGCMTVITWLKQAASSASQSTAIAEWPAGSGGLQVTIITILTTRRHYHSPSSPSLTPIQVFEAGAEHAEDDMMEGAQ